MARFFLLLWIAVTPILSYAQINPQNVTIIRDQWGVPHVYGNTDAEAAYGLAYAQAEDNFFEMQTNLLIARGRYGEVVGKEGAPFDYIVSLARINEMVAAQYEADVSPEFKEILKGFCQGVNDFAEAHPDELRVKKLTPVTPQDILAGYCLSMALLSGVAEPIINTLDGRPEDQGVFQMQEGRGSNAFAFNSNKTADGHVYLANNSHQPLDGNLAWYEAHVVSNQGWNCMGALFPGGVSIFTGCNQDLAWAHTVNLSDFVDTYRLEMHPKNKLQYRFDGKYETLEMRKVKLKVKVGPIKLSVKRKAYWSKYGATIKNKDGDFFSFRFSANMGLKAAEQWYRMNKARNFTEFYRTLNMGGLCSTNIIYADANDTIFYIDNGNFPFRDRAYNWKSVLPGDTSATLWTDFHSTEELVQVIQPQSGYVYNCNNSPFNSTAPIDNPRPRDFDPTLGNYIFPTNRSIRFEELISELDRVSWDDFLRIKYDNQYPDSMFIPFMANANDIFRLDPIEFSPIADEIRLMKEWDRRGDTDSEAASLSLLTVYFLQKRIGSRKERSQHKVIPKQEIAECMYEAKQHLIKHFGSARVPLGKLQRLVRGENDYPLHGLEDQIASMRSVPWEDGRFKGELGDTYIQLVRFSEKGIEVSSSINFGASNRPESPHYNDQVDLSLNKKTKEMRFEKEWIEANAERIYHPGE